MPPRQGLGKLTCAPVVDEPLPATVQLVLVDPDRGREGRAGRLREHAEHVLPPAGVAGAADPVAVERPPGHHAAFPRLLETQRHQRAEVRGDAPHERVDVRRDRVRERRHELPRPGRTHHVEIEEELGVPVAVHEAVERPALRLRQIDEVAVVVVPGVAVVQERRLRPLVRRPQPLPIPRDRGLLAVGVERGHDQQDHAVEPLRLRAPLRGGGEPVRQQQRGLRPRHLVGVNSGRDQCAAGQTRDQPLAPGLIESARVRDPRPPGAQLLQSGHVRRAADDRRDHRPALDGRAQGDNAHAAARSGEGAQVPLALRVARQHPVGADVDAEHVARRRRRGERPRGADDTVENEQRRARQRRAMDLHPASAATRVHSSTRIGTAAARPSRRPLALGSAPAVLLDSEL